jgi:excisionase family DNA binding protein
MSLEHAPQRQAKRGTARLERQGLTVEEAGRVLGLGGSAAYRAARRGDLPLLRIGRKLIVPIQALERMMAEAE